MGGIAVALMFLTKQQTHQSIKSKNDADLAMAKSEIIGLLNTPSHCNANFKNLSTAAASAVTNLYTCTSGACTATTGARVSKFAAIPTGWPGTAQVLAGQISERVKIASITRTMTGSTAGSNAVNLATLEIKFVLKSITGPETNQVIKFPVAIITNGTTVQGCPKSTNSTQPY